MVLFCGVKPLVGIVYEVVDYPDILASLLTLPGVIFGLGYQFAILVAYMHCATGLLFVFVFSALDFFFEALDCIFHFTYPLSAGLWHPAGLVYEVLPKTGSTYCFYELVYIGNDYFI